MERRRRKMALIRSPPKGFGQTTFEPLFGSQLRRPGVVPGVRAFWLRRRCSKSSQRSACDRIATISRGAVFDRDSRESRSTHEDGRETDARRRSHIEKVGGSGLYGVRMVWLVFLIDSAAVAERVPLSRHDRGTPLPDLTVPISGDAEPLRSKRTSAPVPTDLHDQVLVERGFLEKITSFARCGGAAGLMNDLVIANRRPSISVVKMG